VADPPAERGVFVPRPTAGDVRMAVSVDVGVRVRGNAGNRAAVGTEHRLRDTIILIALVATPSIGILLLGLTK
jgi:hypothetical protein